MGVELAEVAAAWDEVVVEDTSDDKDVDVTSARMQRHAIRNAETGMSVNGDRTRCLLRRMRMAFDHFREVDIP